jgi:hypothetical protein
MRGGEPMAEQGEQGVAVGRRAEVAEGAGRGEARHSPGGEVDPERRVVAVVVGSEEDRRAVRWVGGQERRERTSGQASRPSHIQVLGAPELLMSSKLPAP